MKNHLKRYFPNLKTIKENKQLQVFGDLLHDPNLWHINRHSVSTAVAIGFFVAFIPIPFQMLIAAMIAIIFRANLPIAVSVVWITNPATMPVLFYFAYVVGAFILDTPIVSKADIAIELSFHWIFSKLSNIQFWESFLLGCFLLGITSAILAYVSICAVWRWHIIRYLKLRLKRKQITTTTINIIHKTTATKKTDK